MIALVASLLVGCAPEPASIKFTGEPTVTVHTMDAVAVNKATVLDKEGKAIDPQPKLTWKVTPDTVAKLDEAKGMVTPVGNGEATVEASVGTVKGSYKFVVALPDKVEIAGYSGPIGVGASVTLTGTVKAGDMVVPGQTVTWSTSDDKVATVDAGGIVTGVAVGKATITGTSGSLTATVEVEVSDAVAAAPAATEAPKQ